jgi:uncharacterized protein (TIGR00369 family)
MPALPPDVTIPFAQHLGFTLIKFANGEAEMHYTPLPEHLNSFSVTHGGASMTLLDVAMSSAARSVQPEMGAVTIEMKTSFMQAALGPLVAKARLLHRSVTLAFVEASLLDAQGQLCAHATGTFKYVKRLPVGRTAAQPLNTGQ